MQIYPFEKAPEEYAAALDRLVKEGKLTPEQARQLLEQYKKQHANALLQQSAKVMDGMIKSGGLPIEVANRLLTAQRNNTKPADYAALLQDQVMQGKLSPAAAQQLLAQYTQQRAREVTMRSIASLRSMARAGQLTPDVLAQLEGLENRMVPIDVYAATLQQLLNQGKIVPAVSGRILNEYRDQRAEIGPTASIDKMLQDAERAAYDEIAGLVRAGRMSQDVANQLLQLIQTNVSLDNYKSAINQLVQQGKLTPDIARLKVADYQTVKGLREAIQSLGALQANNVPISTYADALRKAVQSGALTPDQASQLLKEYAAMTGPVPTGEVPTTTNGTPADQAFAALQAKTEATQAAPVGPAATDFTAAQTQETQVTDQDRQARIDALATAMAGQAQQLIAAWEPPSMMHREGVPETKTQTKTTTTTATGTTVRGGESGVEGANGMAGAPIIKAGTILFATLDTTVNSDYPDSPVLATIVSGKYKGAKLLGKMVTTKGPAGQQDRISLNFTMMNMDAWPTTKSVTAYAIDPDTARTAIASQVNYHYFKRYGAIMAFAFLQGYSTAITNAGTSTTGIFGTSTTHNPLSPSQKLMVGFGQVGQTMGAAIQNYINIPPTVKVDSGVGLGILFMSDVS